MDLKEKKTYSRRDSATSVLRKMGIDKSKYNDFIESYKGSFICKIGLARKSLVNPSKKKGETVSSVARQMILDGHSNLEVFEGLLKKFGPKVITDKKRNYPCWYRYELRTKGFIKDANTNRQSLINPDCEIREVDG